MIEGIRALFDTWADDSNITLGNVEHRVGVFRCNGIGANTPARQQL